MRTLPIIALAAVVVCLLSTGCNRQDRPQNGQQPPQPTSDESDADSNEFIKYGEQVVFYRRGFEFMMQKEFELAIEQFDKAIELDSDFSLAHYSRAQAHDKLGNTAAALADFEIGRASCRERV